MWAVHRYKHAFCFGFATGPSGELHPSALQLALATRMLSTQAVYDAAFGTRDEKRNWYSGKEVRYCRPFVKLCSGKCHKV